MLRSFFGAIACLMFSAVGARAFDVEATINKVDADKGVVTFTSNQKERHAKAADNLKVVGADGKELADGLKATELKEGAKATLTIEAVNNQPVLRIIKLGKQGEKTAPVLEAPRVDTSGLTPLTDLGQKQYQGFPGGLYPEGKNERPQKHLAAGLALAKQVQPLGPDGKPSPDGKIVLLGIGFSNTVQSFDGFMAAARDATGLNPKLVLINGAVGGRSANMIQNPDDHGKGQEYWETIDARLKAAGLTRAQVQAFWIKETNPGPHEGKFPGYIQTLQAELTKIVQILPQRFPNGKLAYLSSRTYAGWAKAMPKRSAPGNSEPYSYETGFAVKWLIEQQLKGEATLNFDAASGAVKAPWLSWGPYLWANGETKRQDGFSFKPTDFRDNDRMHHSPDGQKKIGNQLLQFFKSDPTSKGWFLKEGS
jgi:hypothetical protein